GVSRLGVAWISSGAQGFHCGGTSIWPRQTPKAKPASKTSRSTRNRPKVMPYRQRDGTEVGRAILTRCFAGAVLDLVLVAAYNTSRRGRRPHRRIAPLAFVGATPSRRMALMTV